jgi:hypothetical protein
MILRIGVAAVSLSAGMAQAAGLQFAWAPGMSCRVEQRNTATNAPETTLKYTLTATEGKDGGLFIEARLPEFGLEDNTQARLLLASRLPAFEVGEGGSLLGLRDPADARSSVRSAFAASLPAPISDGELDQMADVLGNPATLENQVSNFWNPAVEQWVGKELGDKPLVGTAETSITGTDVPLSVTVTLERGEPTACTRGGRERECVELIAVEVPASDKLREVMSAILGAEGAAEIKKIKSMRMVTRTVTVTEPDTLIPHLVTVDRTITIMRARQPAADETVERQTWQFDCD